MALSLTVAESLAARLRGELFARLLGRDALFFDRVRTGQMTSWLGQDIEVLEVRGAGREGAFLRGLSWLAIFCMGRAAPLLNHALLYQNVMART